MVDVGGQYALLTARAPTGTVLQATGSGVTLATRDVAAVNQRWSTQWLTTNTWQYVNLGTGMCLTAPSTAGAVTMSPCTGASNQAFVLETAGTVGTQDPDVVIGEAQAEAVASSPADAGTSDHLVADSPSTEDVPADGAELTGPGPTEPPTDVLDLTDGTTAVEGSTEVEGGTQSDEPAAQPEETTNGPEPDLLEDTDRG